MWDWIVDETGAPDNDYTQPDRLEGYLVDQVGKICERRGIGRIASEVKAGQETGRNLKLELRQRFPERKDFTENLKQVADAMERMTRTFKEQRESGKTGPGTWKDEDDLQASFAGLVAGVADERVTNTTTVDGRKETYTWTGWILLKGSQAAAAEFAGPPLIPSVAYRKSDSPGQRYDTKERYA
jgi:hypothetical protein